MADDAAAQLAFDVLVAACLAGVSLAPRHRVREPLDADQRRETDRIRKCKERSAGRPRPSPADLAPGPASRHADDQQVEQLELAIRQRWR